MTHTFSLALVLGVVGAGAAFAQTGASSPVPPAVSTTSADSKTAAAPLAGANSFTESEARSRLQAHGYTDVSELKKDDKSIWRGTATKDGKPSAIALDYQGNIVAQ
jgi:putative membrane protein